MKKPMKLLALLLALLLMLSACSAGQTPAQTPSSDAQEAKTTAPAEQPAEPAETEEPAPVNTAFEPQLDTEAEVSLEAAVFFSNFEAFDQVINHFNEFYPNVSITYSQTGDSSTAEFLENNPVDIFMTSYNRGYPVEYCADLYAAGVDVSAVADGLLNAGIIDGKLLAVPMGLTLKGIVVNKTLLESLGLSVPQTWDEFLAACETLKQNGYVPIQGPTSKFTQIAYDMGMAMLADDPALLQAVYDGDASGAAALAAVYERVAALQSGGYFSDEINAEYPEDNYDGAILRFFEGDVPFWVCDTEKVSGMKKRESKSEAFSANPFEYEFTFAPLGDNGVYEYVEPWYGFAVNNQSASYDYAIEFLRFLARQDELNTLASVKGVPSATKSSPDDRYSNLNSIEHVERSVVSDGTVPAYFGTLLCHAADDLLTGEVAAPEEAVADFVNRCVESLQSEG